MSIDTNGLLQGIARTNGLYTVTVTVVDANGLTFSRVLQLNVVAPLPLRVTPAMEAGLANHVWSIEEVVGLLDRSRAVAA